MAPRRPRREGGAALLMAMLMLVLMGMIGLASLDAVMRDRQASGFQNLSQSALSQHLAVLRREKIVSARKDAQSVFYSLAGDEATKVMETLHDLFCGARAGKD